MADFARHYLGLTGPAVVVSSACSSSAKVFASARRMMAAGLIDAAVVGGVDSLCLTTLYGFNSLGLMSSQACRPFDVARDGISIGEAAAFALLERVPEHLDANAVLLLGVGESSDAHHMSSPHPDGLGARMAMQRCAGKRRNSMRPTSTTSTCMAPPRPATTWPRPRPSRQCSVRARRAVPPRARPDTRWARRARLEAVICALALQNDLLPGGLNTQQLDPLLPLNYLLENREQPVAPRPQQFVRLWRHQLQPDFRPRRLKTPR